jgi:transposase
MTGVDLEGNTLEFGRDNKYRLNEVRHRASAMQHVMSKFKSHMGKSKRWQYRAFAKAKRTFTSCVAKLKNLVKDLHYKTCAYLTEHYDVILLPIFKTKGMVRRSSARTHGFNTSILSLNHFKFRQLLQAKCAVKGKSLVVCSEMNTSSDVFTCPFCAYRAVRDENAALNILRDEFAGPQQVFE